MGNTKVKLGLLFALFVFFTACKSKDHKIKVAVASNAQFALEEIVATFERKTGKQVDLIVGSSGKLTAQIMEGAPFAIFLSADMEYPEALYTKGLTVSEPEIYAYGSPVLWTLNDFEISNIKTVLLPEVKSIAIANPELAPYGGATIQALKYYGLLEQAKPKLVYGESISQVTQYIVSKSADIGFSAKSVVLSPKMKGKGKWLAMDKNTYTPIAQGAVLIKKTSGRNREGAKELYQYIFSDAAKEIFKDYGYQFEN